MADQCMLESLIMFTRGVHGTIHCVVAQLATGTARAPSELLVMLAAQEFFVPLTPRIAAEICK